MCKTECINTEVEVIELSKEGMKIKSSYYLSKNNDISFSVILPNLDIIKIGAEIIWDKKVEEHEFYYGIKINKITSSDESSFLSLITELK